MTASNATPQWQVTDDDRASWPEGSTFDHASHATAKPAASQERPMSIKESWEYGFDAALAGKPRENLNPWNASLHSAWLRGWDAGDQRRRELSEGRQITSAVR